MFRSVSEAVNHDDKIEDFAAFSGEFSLEPHKTFSSKSISSSFVENMIESLVANAKQLDKQSPEKHFLKRSRGTRNLLS